MIKGILFDIDDTLFDHSINEVPFLTAKALRKLKEAGIKTGVCTSREINEVYKLPEIILKETDVQILGTGSHVLKDGEVIKNYIFPYEITKKYIDYFESHNISYHYSTKDKTYYFWGDRNLFKTTRIMHHFVAYPESKRWSGEEVVNMSFYFATYDQIEEIRKINNECYITTWDVCGQITPPYCDKSFGVLKFCEIFGFTTDEVMAFGDGGNDDIMLKMAGVGVAVANAKDKTKEAADYVLKKSLKDGGIYDFLVEQGLIKDDKHDIKILFFDIDNTTYVHEPEYDCVPSTKYALRELKKNGYKLVVCTSRGKDEMKMLPDIYKEVFDGYICLAGAYVELEGKVSYTEVDKEHTRKLIEYMDQRPHITYRYTTKDGMGYLNQEDDSRASIFRRLYLMEPPVKKWEGEEILQFLSYTNEQEDRLKFEEICRSEKHIQFKNCDEITPSGTEKGLKMLEIAKSYGFTKDNVCAFGDGLNDVEMLRLAGLGICMGNGSDEAKNVADFVTDDIREDGLYKACVKFGFIDKCDDFE